MMSSKVIYLSELKYRAERRGLRTWYVLETPIEYYSERYNKHVVVPEGRESDGATGALDIHSRAWWVHDELCTHGIWADGTPVTNWQASSVLADILRLESRPGRSVYWWIATWLFGCDKARRHGNWPWSKG
jgi:hypothetical protein